MLAGLWAVDGHVVPVLLTFPSLGPAGEKSTKDLLRVLQTNREIALAIDRSRRFDCRTPRLSWFQMEES